MDDALGSALVASMRAMSKLGDFVLLPRLKNAAAEGVLSSPPSSYELNAMIVALGDRGKASAALGIYRGTIAAAAAASAAAEERRHRTTRSGGIVRRGDIVQRGAATSYRTTIVRR